MTDPGQKSPAERVLDLTVYGPLGLAITIAESIPQFVRKGRSRLGPQIGLARTVGEFAVRQGYRQMRGLAAQRGPLSFRPAPGPDRHQTAARTAHKPASPSTPAHNGAGTASHHPGPTRSGPGAAPGVGASGGGRGDDNLAAAHLAIPSYDSLSASQVVQRLAGLSRDEVEAVRAYEAATRGRRTVLARAEQLLA